MPAELRAPVLAAAAYNAFQADDYPLTQRRAEQALAEPVSGDPYTSLLVRAIPAIIFTFTGQPERAIGLTRELGQEAAERGIEFWVGFLLALGAMARTRAGDYAAARPTVMEAVEIARRVRNPGLSATMSWAAAEVIWRSETQVALLLHRGQPDPDPCRSLRHRSR